MAAFVGSLHELFALLEQFEHGGPGAPEVVERLARIGLLAHFIPSWLMPDLRFTGGSRELADDVGQLAEELGAFLRALAIVEEERRQSTIH